MRSVMRSCHTTRRATFAPISSGADVSIAVSVPASLKIESLARLGRVRTIATRKAQLGSHTQARSTMSCRVFSRGAGLELTHISYKDIAPALQDLSEARIHLYVSALASQLGMVRSGNIKVVAITNSRKKRLDPRDADDFGSRFQ